VKTRLQTANFESKAKPSTPSSSVPSFTSTTSSSVAQKRLTIPSVFSQIYRDSIQSHRYRYRSTVPYSIFSSLFPPQPGSASNLVDGRPGPNPKAEKWTMRVLGLRGFGVGLRPTVVSSFVGSAATISESFFVSVSSSARAKSLEVKRKWTRSKFVLRLTRTPSLLIATVEVALHLMGVNGGGGVG